jgi:hypothetical protein
MTAALKPIVLDEPDTWPSAVRALLAEGAEVLRAHAHFESTRYTADPKRSKRDSQAVQNPFAAGRKQLLDRIDHALTGSSILAYHCTRFTEDELQAVRTQGLIALNAEGMFERLARRVQAGDLTQTDATRMLERFKTTTAAHPETRIGKVWAAPSKGALLDEDGLSTRLTYWGGEAILSLTHPDRHVLAGIGTACVVEFLAPVSKLCFALAESLAAFTLHQGDNADAELCDICIEASIAGADVRRIVRRSDADFETMTGCLTWRSALT